LRLQRSVAIWLRFWEWSASIYVGCRIRWRLLKR
jgi:hypothetical protein